LEHKQIARKNKGEKKKRENCFADKRQKREVDRSHHRLKNKGRKGEKSCRAGAIRNGTTAL
jgi:hypothetical protein